MMRTAALWMMMVTLAVTAACTLGRVRPYPSGMTLELRPPGQVRTGELLAAPDSGVLFLYGGAPYDSARVVFTPFSDEIELRTRPPWPTVRFRGRPSPDNLGRLRFHSRYPLGLDDETLTQLMSMLDQRRAEVWP